MTILTFILVEFIMTCSTIVNLDVFIFKKFYYNYYMFF